MFVNIIIKLLELKDLYTKTTYDIIIIIINKFLKNVTFILS